MIGSEPYNHPPGEHGREKSVQLKQSFWIATGFFSLDLVATWGCNQLNYTYNKRSSIKERGIFEENLL